MTGAALRGTTLLVTGAHQEHTVNTACATPPDLLAAAGHTTVGDTRGSGPTEGKITSRGSGI
jgi:hypothetical protein